MLIKIHKAYREIVAVCDEEILGKTFEEGKTVLEVRESFFNGDKIEEKELEKTLRDFSTSDATFNIIGEKSVKCAIKAGVITKEGVKKVKGIPFALVLL